MKYVPLGRSGLLVSRICLGGNSWGAKGRRSWAPFGLEESRPFFRRALDRGINFFDTADAYNAGESEEILGECLVGATRRDDLVISTKIGHKMNDAPNASGVGRKHLMDGVDASLRRLRTDYIDVYQIHRLDGVTPIEETMAALTDMVRMGKVRYIGGSTMPAWRFAQMTTRGELGASARPVAMQNLYNLVQREEEREMIPLCHEQGVGLIPYSPLARGFLAANRKREGGGDTERARLDTVVKPGSWRDCDFAIADAVAAIAKQRGVKPTQVALAWLLSKPFVASPILGATKLEYIDDAAAAVDLTLTADEIRALEDPYEWRVPPAN